MKAPVIHSGYGTYGPTYIEPKPATKAGPTRSGRRALNEAGQTREGEGTMITGRLIPTGWSGNGTPIHRIIRGDTILPGPRRMPATGRHRQGCGCSWHRHRRSCQGADETDAVLKMFESEGENDDHNH